MRGDVSIAVIAPLQPEDFYDLLWQGVWEATFDLGTFGVQVHNLATDGLDVDKQLELLSHVRDEGISSVAILPAHETALNDRIAGLETSGIPVVTFQGDAPASRRSAFVGADPFQAGALAGEVLMKLMGGAGNVACYPGALERHDLAQRYAGLRAEFSRHGCATLEGIDPKCADGIYCGDENLIGIANELEQAGIRKPCVGFGSTIGSQPFLERETLSAVIDEHRYQQGYLAVHKAYEAVLKRGQNSVLTSVEIGPAVVFAANARDSGESVVSAFEGLVRQRTEVLLSYKERLEQANAELLNLSITDPLTGLLNRRKFEETMQTEAARAMRYEPVSLLMIDLNRFKAINDRYGHLVGDEALKAVAETLKNCCRGTDFCARIGGDEFAVILPHTEVRQASVVRDRILRQLRMSRVRAGDRELTIDLSVGIATLPHDAASAEALMAAADAAMYQMKQATRTVA